MTSRPLMFIFQVKLTQAKLDKSTLCERSCMRVRLRVTSKGSLLRLSSHAVSHFYDAAQSLSLQGALFHDSWSVWTQNSFKHHSVEKSLLA